jgi:hypothetical protein
VTLDEASPVDVSETQKGSGVQLASYLFLDVINNVCETRNSLHRMADDFRIRNTTLEKPHPYKGGDSVLLSTISSGYQRGVSQLFGAFSTPLNPLRLS